MRYALRTRSAVHVAASAADSGGRGAPPAGGALDDVAGFDDAGFGGGERLHGTGRGGACAFGGHEKGGERGIGGIRCASQRTPTLAPSLPPMRAPATRF